MILEWQSIQICNMYHNSCCRKELCNKNGTHRQSYASLVRRPSPKSAEAPSTLEQQLSHQKTQKKICQINLIPPAVSKRVLSNRGIIILDERYPVNVDDSNLAALASLPVRII